MDRSKREIEREIDRLQSELRRKEEGYDPEYCDRPRGVLTQRERRYLVGEGEVTPGTQEERSLRQAIRGHIVHSLLDFPLLANVEARDIDLILEHVGTEDIDDAIEFLESLKRR